MIRIEQGSINCEVQVNVTTIISNRFSQPLKLNTARKLTEQRNNLLVVESHAVENVADVCVGRGGAARSGVRQTAVRNTGGESKKAKMT